MPDYLNAELQAFLAAPMIFVGAWIPIAIIVWRAMQWAYGERIASKDEQILTRDEKIKNLEGRLAGAESRLERLAQPISFRAAEIASAAELNSLEEAVTLAIEGVEVRAAEWRRGFPELRDTLKTNEAIIRDRVCGGGGGIADASQHSPEEIRYVKGHILQVTADLHRTADELMAALDVQHPKRSQG